MSADLRDLLQESVADASPDLVGIGERARRQGLAIRRGRQALAVAGVTAVVAVALMVPQLLQGSARVDSATPPFRLSTAGPLGPLTGPAAVQVLFEAVAQLSDGAGDQFEAESTDDGAFAGLTWTPADGSGWFVVTVDVRLGSGTSSTDVSCTSVEVACTVTSLTGGARLKVAELRTPSGSETGRKLVADLLRPDGTRVTATAANGRDLGAGQWEVTRPAPGLTAEQLRAIVEQPVWGARVPVRYDTAGRDLPGLRTPSPSR